MLMEPGGAGNRLDHADRLNLKERIADAALLF